jgi:hypothetical protein
MRPGFFFSISALVSAVWAAEAPVELFSGNDLSGWRMPMGTWSAVENVVVDPANLKAFLAKPGAGVLLNSAGGKTVDALTEGEFGDCELRLEFCVPKGSNSGVYIMGRYEVQIFDSFGKKEVTSSDCGGIYERWKDNRGYEGHAPKVNASRPPGEWQSFEITFHAPRFDASGRKIENARFVKVLLNGQVVQENVEVTGPTRSARFHDEKPVGPLMLQGDHGPVALRNIRLTPVAKP